MVRPKDDVGHAAATTGWAGRRLEEAGRGRGRFRPSFGHVHERLMDDPGDVQLLGGADAGEIRAGLEGPPVGRLASARAEVIAMSLRLLAVQPRTAGKKRVVFLSAGPGQAAGLIPSAKREILANMLA